MAVQKLNSKGVVIGDAVISVVIVSIIIIAVGVMLTDYEDAYNVGVVNDLGEYDQLDNASSMAQSQKTSISPNDPDPSEDSEANTFRGGYGIITGVLTSLSLVFGSQGMLQSISDRFNLPDYIVQGLITIMIISLVFSIIAVIFRLSRSKT